MTSYIYFIQAQGNGPIKIGFTGDNPRKRMVKIQSDCPWPVTLLGAIEGTVAQEKEIHLVLRRWRTQGEWFSPNTFVLAAVKEAMECGRPAPFPEKEDGFVDPAWHPLRKWREAASLTQVQAGILLDTTSVNVSRWEGGMRLPHRRFWKRIEAVTGVSPGILYECAVAMVAGAAQ